MKPKINRYKIIQIGTLILIEARSESKNRRERERAELILTEPRKKSGSRP